MFYEKMVLILGFLHYFTGWTGVLAYLGVLRSKFRLLRPEILWLVFPLVILWALQYSRSGVIAVYSARFYWGWLLFYCVFLAKPVPFGFLKKLLLILAVYTILEAVAVNTFLDPRSLPNFPGSVGAKQHFAAPGNYQRPYSFGGNATVTSSLLVALLCYLLPVRAVYLLSTLAIFLSASVTGIIAYVFSQLCIAKKYLIKIGVARILLLLLVFFLIIFLNRSFFDRVLYKLSFKYLFLVLKIKVGEFQHILSKASFCDLIIGRRINDPRSLYGFGGSAFLGFLKFNGIFGVIFFFVFTCLNLSRKILLPASILIVASFHYPAIFSLPGQVLFGLLLAEGSNEAMFKTFKKAIDQKKGD